MTYVGVSFDSVAPRLMSPIISLEIEYSLVEDGRRPLALPFGP